VNADTDPPLDPFAERLAASLDRVAEKAGQAGGTQDDELDTFATAVVTQLRQEATWTGPPPELRASVLARALTAEVPTDDPRPETPRLSAVAGPEPGVDLATSMTDAAHQPEEPAPAGGLPARWRRLRYAVPLAVAAAVLFAVGVVAIDRSIRQDTPSGQHYVATSPVGEGQRPRIDLIVSSTGAAGFSVTIQPHDLPGAGEGQYYAAWLRKPGSTDAYVPLGSFHARQPATIRLWSGVSPRDYPEFVITLQREGEPSIPSDQVVATARLR
jgi:hypothetical protein